MAIKVGISQSAGYWQGVYLQGWGKGVVVDVGMASLKVKGGGC